MAMPPYAIESDFDVINAYFSVISNAVNTPVWIQNAGLVPMCTDQVVRLCTEIEDVNWVDEEVPPTPRSIGALCARQNLNVHGVMGGVGDLYLPTEHARGVDGCFVACECCDLLQDLWDALESGDAAAIGTLFYRVQPLIVLESLLVMSYSKEIMIRRGVFTNSRMRMQTKPLDAQDMLEIDRQWERIKPYMNTKI